MGVFGRKRNLHFGESDSRPLMINDFSLLMAVENVALKPVTLARLLNENDSISKKNCCFRC